MKIIVQGSLAFDRIMDFPDEFQNHILPDQIHQLNVSFFIPQLIEKRGGCAGNIAYTLHLLGSATDVELLGAVGRDFASYQTYLDSLGISSQFVSVEDELPSAAAYMITDKTNNQISAFHMGAAAQPCKQYDFASLDPEEAIVISGPRNCKEDVLRAAKECKENGVRFIFDPGQTIPIFEAEDFVEIITGSHMFISNDYELRMVLDKTGWSEDELRDRTDVHVVTLGEQGSTIHVASDTIAIPPCHVDEVKDPTGAGDAYRAGLLNGLVEGLSLEQAGRIGSLCATYAIEKHGTQEHAFAMDEFATRYVENFEEECPLVG